MELFNINMKGQCVVSRPSEFETIVYASSDAYVCKIVLL